jgi:outer membrane murein-binding lipoprotein Lpp
MGFLDKAKAAAEQAAAKAKEGVEEVQTKRELGQAYGELGRTAFELLESGEISHDRLEAIAVKVRELNEKVAASDGSPAAATADEPVAHDPDQPPAMPS